MSLSDEYVIKDLGEEDLPALLEVCGSLILTFA
jgi:hypothetical protein